MKRAGRRGKRDGILDDVLVHAKEGKHRHRNWVRQADSRHECTLCNEWGNRQRRWRRKQRDKNGHKEPTNAILEHEMHSAQRSHSLMIVAADIFCTSNGQYKHVATERFFARANAPRQKNDTGSIVRWPNTRPAQSIPTTQINGACC